MTESLAKEVEAGLVKTSEITDQIIPAMSSLIDKIAPAIATLSDKLGTTTEHLWVILVKQNYNLAIGNGIIIILTLFVLYASFYSTDLWNKKIDNENWSSEGESGIIVIRIIASIISVIIVITNFVNLTQRLINPEYYALLKILNFLK